MQLQELKISQKKKPRKRVGRGGKKGTYSGKGMKGQKSRSGKSPRAGFTGGDTSLIKRLPKQRGSVGKVPIRRGQKIDRLRKLNRPVSLALEKINKSYKENDIISLKSLFEKGLISKIKGRWPKVKIIGSGEFKKGFVFRGVIFSKNLKEKIVKLKEKSVKKTKTKEKGKEK